MSFNLNKNSPNFKKQIFSKEDFLNDLEEIKNFVKKEILNIKNKINEINNNVINSLNNFNLNQKTLLNFYYELNSKSKIFSDFEENKLLIKNKFNEFSLKISENEKFLLNLQYKFDKIYLENFFYPSLIGNEKTRFKTFKDLIEFLIEKIDFFIEFKKKNEKIINEINENCDKNLKFSLKQIEINENKNKIYFDNFKKEIDEKFVFFYKEMIKKTEELKIQNSNYSLNLIKKTDELIKLKNEFDNFNSIIKNSIEKTKKTFDEMEKKRNNQIDVLINKINEFDKKINKNEKNDFNEKIKILFDKIEKINKNINKLKENIY